MAHCIQHVQCPKCADEGKDRNGNNLAVYSDNSQYCFSCGHYVSAKGFSKYTEKVNRDGVALGLPYDVATELPEVAWNFLRQYALTEQDVKQHVILWSQHWQRLCFPVFGDDSLLAWQGRYLGTEKGKAKWFSQGDLNNTLHLVGNKKANTIVLTEDLISAIKVGHIPTLCAMPIFGSHVSTQRLLRLKKLYGTLNVLIWLDKDKQKESVKFTKNANLLGINSRSIITDKDPKEYTEEEIHKWVYN